MKRFLTLTICAFAMSLCANAQTDTEFWFCIPQLTTQHETDEPMLFITSASDETAHVTIEMPLQPLFEPVVLAVPSGEQRSYNFKPYLTGSYSGEGNFIESGLATGVKNETVIYESCQILNKGFRITSDHPITAYLQRGKTNNCDIWALKGRNAFGEYFIVPSEDIGNCNEVHSTAMKAESKEHPGAWSAIDIVAVEDCQVTVTLRETGLVTQWPNNTQTATFNMKRGQTLNLQAAQQVQIVNNNKSPYKSYKDKNLTGTVIKSTGKIVVQWKDDSVLARWVNEGALFNRDSTKRIEGGQGTSWDAVGDQLVPVELAGTEYIVMRGQLGDDYVKGGTPNRMYENVYFMSTVNGPTTVEFITDEGEILPSQTLSGIGDWSKLLLNAYNMTKFDNQKNYNAVHIKADNPIIVWHISGSSGAEVGGAILPRINGCTGTTDVSVCRSSNSSFDFWLNIMCKKAHIGDFTLIINNETTQYHLDPNWFKEIPGTGWCYLERDHMKFSSKNGNIPPVGLGKTIKIRNSTGLFHLAVINGNSAASCQYGYFSDFLGNSGSAFFTGDFGEEIPYLPFCLGDTIQLQAFGGMTYWWEYATEGYSADKTFVGNDAAAVANERRKNNPKVVPAKIGANDYKVTIKRRCYAVSPDTTILIEAYGIPTTKPDFNLDIQPCSPANVVVTNTTNTGTFAYDFLWTLNDGDTVIRSTKKDFGNDTLVFVNTTNANMNYTLTLETSIGSNCPLKSTKSFSVCPGVNAIITPDKTTGCQQFEVEFGNESIGSYTQMVVDYGDGSARSLYTTMPDKFKHTFVNNSNKDTTYYVRVWIVDEVNGCNDSTKVPIRVNKHSIVVDNAVAASRTSTGLTQGSHCSVCGAVLVKQEIIPIITDDTPITFADPNVKTICVTNWDTNSDGELSYAEAAAVTDLEEVFKGNAEIVSFDELQYFTGLANLGDFAFSNCESLSSVTIPNSVSSIGEAAFYTCSSLTSIIIPEGVTSIDYLSFNRCYNLKSASFPNTLTNIGSYTFACCDSLKSITIPEYVSTVGSNAFGLCGNLSSVIVKARTPPVAESNVFFYVNHSIPVYVPCGSLSAYQDAFEWSEFTNIKEDCQITFADARAKEICIANWDTNKDGELSYSEAAAVTDLGEVFTAETDIVSFNELQYFTGITSLDEDAFRYCPNLISVTIPNSVTTIVSAFNGCSKLESINIPNSVTDIRNAFYGCTSLTSISIPDSIENFDFDYFFSDCDNLQYNEYDNTYYLGNNDNPYLVLIKAKSAHITTCTIPNGCRIINSDAFRLNDNEHRTSGCHRLTTINIPSTVKCIGDGAFANCLGLKELYIPSSVKHIGRGAFINVKNVIYYGDAEKIESYGFANPWGALNINGTPDANGFFYADSVVQEKSSYSGFTANRGKTITAYVGNGGDVIIPDDVINIDECAFSECRNITSVTFPETVEFIGHGAFWHCENLGPITLPNSVRIIGSATFLNCPKVTSIHFGNSIALIGSLAIDVVDTTLQKVDISDIGNWCKVGLGSSYQVNPINQSHTLYIDGEEVTNLVIPETVTKIGHGVFYGCHSFQTVTIPSTVTYIGYSAFDDCTNISSFTIKAETPPILSSYYHFFNGDMSIPVYVPCNAVEAYRNAPKWNEFTNIIGYHTEVTDNAKAATCTESGLTEGKHCSVCNTVLVAQKVIPAKGHTIVVDSAVAATYTSTGLTEGSHCSVCGQVIVAQTEIPMLTGVDTIYIVQRDTIYNIVSKTDTVFVSNSDTIYSITHTSDTIYSTQIDTVYSVITKFDTVYNVINKVDTIYNIVNNYDTIYSTQIDTVYSVITKFDTVYNVINKVDTVYSIINTRDTVFSFASRIDTVYSIINTVDTIYCVVNKTDTIHTHTTDTLYIVSRDTIWLSPAAPCHLYILSSDIAMGIVDGGGKFEIGAEASISAVPKSGFRFTQWSDGNLSASRTIILENDVLLMAYFEPIMYTITGRTANGNMGIVYGSGNYTANSIIEIAALPNYGYHFVRWNDGETTNPRKITVTSNKTFTAEFKVNNYELMAAANEQKMGKVTGTATYEYLSRPQIKATANAGYHFTGWSDGETANPREVLVYSDTTIVAMFEADALTPEEAVAQTIDNIMGHIHAIITDDDEMAVNEVNIYAYNNKIVVENATDEIRVYDAMGKLICRDTINRVRTEITINNTGVYIVKTGNVVKRVMVN
ncbi:MAG: leucine-rich repeat domain-containing protein [Salinivirgaceae bacterium]|nr:leucine-rich repeat domain-containing protein [Salinivirgaceae bacterium]